MARLKIFYNFALKNSFSQINRISVLALPIESMDTLQLNVSAFLSFYHFQINFICLHFLQNFTSKFEKIPALLPLVWPTTPSENVQREAQTLWLFQLPISFETVHSIKFKLSSWSHFNDTFTPLEWVFIFKGKCPFRRGPPMGVSLRWATWQWAPAGPLKFSVVAHNFYFVFSLFYLSNYCIYSLQSPNHHPLLFNACLCNYICM